MLGLTKKEITAKFDEIVAFAELEDFIDAPVKTYSSGMYMRLGFAIAINVNPEILLIDEVLAVGDAAFVPKCLDRIDDFRRRQKTILFVSHDLTHGREDLRPGGLAQERPAADDRRAQADRRRLPPGRRRQAGEEISSATARQRRSALGQDDRREDRWGKREVEITRVTLRNLQGQDKHVFSPDEGMQIEMDVVAAAPVDDFVFGIGLFNSQGISCYGTNTNLEDYEPVSLQRRGKSGLPDRAAEPGQRDLLPGRRRPQEGRLPVRLSPELVLVPGLLDLPRCGDQPARPQLELFAGA